MTRTIKLMIIRQGADARGDESISISAPDDLSVAQLKRDHFGVELAAGKRIRIIHMGSELADSTLFQTMQDQSTLHCVIAGARRLVGRRLRGILLPTRILTRLLRCRLPILSLLQ